MFVAEIVIILYELRLSPEGIKFIKSRLSREVENNGTNGKGYYLVGSALAVCPSSLAVIVRKMNFSRI